MSLQRFGCHAQPTYLLASLDGDSAGNAASYSIVDLGRGGGLGTRDDREIRLSSASYDAASPAVTLSPASIRLVLRRHYALRINGAVGGRSSGAGGDLVTLFNHTILAGSASALPGSPAIAARTHAARIQAVARHVPFHRAPW